MHLLAEGGRDAVSTRAVSAAAGVQAPTLYRLFGDKQGLLDAVASRGFADYLGTKAGENAPLGADPVEDLRTGWDRHVALGLANPALYALMYAEPRPDGWPPAASAAFEVLRGTIARIAAAGRLRVTEARAAEMVHAAGSGTTLTLIATPADRRDPDLSSRMREAMLAAVLTDAPSPTTPAPASAAVALRALLPRTTVLSSAEEALLIEWLDRIAR